MKNNLSLFRLGPLVLVATLSFFTLVTQAVADDIPNFADPSVTKWAQDYAKFVNDYIDAYKTYKTNGDASNSTALQQRSAELQTESQQELTKLESGEQEKFTQFIAICSQKLTDALKQYMRPIFLSGSTGTLCGSSLNTMTLASYRPSRRSPGNVG